MLHFFFHLSHRHRRTEQEEDEELISENKHAQKSVLHFDQNPHCKLLVVLVVLVHFLQLYEIHFEFSKGVWKVLVNQDLSCPERSTTEVLEHIHCC